MSIAYTRAFTQHVKGELKARFQLDENGVPLCEIDDATELRHYDIDLSLEAPAAMARQIDSVTYLLDAETYSDPVAASNDRDNNFTLEISSYGDLEVEVTVQMGKHTYTQLALLSSLLEAGHAGDSSPAIRQALDYVKSH
jgi:hypothetical protein